MLTSLYANAPRAQAVKMQRGLSILVNTIIVLRHPKTDPKNDSVDDDVDVFSDVGRTPFLRSIAQAKYTS